MKTNRYLCSVLMTTQLKNDKMNNEKVLHVVNDVIIDRLTQLIEDMSTNEFVDMIVDKLGVEGIEVETDEEREEVTNLIGSRVIPLLHKITEYGVGKNIPTD